MTEPMACIRMEGTPIARITLRISPLGRKPRKLSCSSRFRTKLNTSARIQAMHCPNTVAAAAPAMPISGNPYFPKIRIGSKMMLITAPTPWEIMVSSVRPVACSSRSNVISKNRKQHRTMQMER